MTSVSNLNGAEQPLTQNNILERLTTLEAENKKLTAQMADLVGDMLMQEKAHVEIYEANIKLVVEVRAFLSRFGRVGN
jgi:chromosome condensin MukBEF ATPase and DNA-binding subunit MukB